MIYIAAMVPQWTIDRTERCGMLPLAWEGIMPVSDDLPICLTCASCKSTDIGTLAADRPALVICENCGHEFRVIPAARTRGLAVSRAWSLELAS